jgi:hypothetical protein
MDCRCSSKDVMSCARAAEKTERDRLTSQKARGVVPHERNDDMIVTLLQFDEIQCICMTQQNVSVRNNSVKKFISMKQFFMDEFFAFSPIIKNGYFFLKPIFFPTVIFNRRPFTA